MIEFVNAITSVQKIANEFSVALSIKNAKRQYFYVNEYWLQALGMELEDVSGKTDDDILSEENAKLAQELDNLAFESGHPIEYAREIELNGTRVRYFVLKWVISFSSGEPFCLCTLSDYYHNKSKVVAFRDRIDTLFQHLRQEES